MIILKNKYDAGINFKDLKEAKSYFDISKVFIDNSEYVGTDIKKDTEKLEQLKNKFDAADSLEKLADILNRIEILLGENGNYYLKEV